MKVSAGLKTAGIVHGFFALCYSIPGITDT